MTGLEDLFHVYRPDPSRAGVYSRFLVDCNPSVLAAAVRNGLATWERAAMPPVGLVRRWYERERAERREVEKAARASAQGADTRRNTPEEFAIMGLIRALHERGATFSTLLNRWVLPGESTYAMARKEPIGSYCLDCEHQADPPRCRMCGGKVIEDRDLTLAECRNAWVRIAPGEPEPKPFGSVAAALEAIP